MYRVQRKNEEAEMEGEGGIRKPVNKIGKVYYCVRKIAWYLTLLATTTMATTIAAAISC